MISSDILAILYAYDMTNVSDNVRSLQAQLVDIAYLLKNGNENQYVKKQN